MGQVSYRIDGEIATVVLSNPGKLNAINVAMWQGLQQTFAALAALPALRCILIHGADANFAAGADIAEFAQVRHDLTSGMHYHNQTIAQALQAMSDCPIPIVAAIQGVCVGGGLEIACGADIRIAAADARFGIPVNRLGFPLAPSELQALLALVGQAVTLEILLEGRVFDAAEAKDKGLIQRIAADPMHEARQTAQRIARGAPLAARMNKQLVRRFSLQAAALDQAEMRAAFAFLDSADYRDGVASFLNKTIPIFHGK